MAKEQPTKVILRNVRLSYANIWEPREDQSGNLKYSVACLIPKSDKKTITAVNKAIEAAKVAGKTKLANKKGLIPKDIKTPLRDADEEDDKMDDEVYAGHCFINANSNRKPQIVDKRKERIEDQDEVYSGCYANVSVNFFAYNTNGNIGIGCGLGNIQKVKDGERLGGGSTADEDFDEIEDDEDDEEFL